MLCKTYSERLRLYTYKYTERRKNESWAKASQKGANLPLSLTLKISQHDYD